jgi:hypothetical protein
MSQPREAEAVERRQRFPGPGELPVERELEAYVLQQRQEGEKVVCLVDETDVTSAEIGSITLGQFGDVGIANPYRPYGWLGQSADDPQQRRFTAATRSGYRDTRPAGHGKGNLIEGPYRTAGRLVLDD